VRGHRRGFGAAGAGASAWDRYRVLSAEHRQERVLVGVVLAGTAGVAAGGLWDWRAGLVTAVATLAAHTYHLRNRPGAATNWRRGAVAERRTGRRLATLDPAAYHVLHDRALPGAPATNLDHLVVGLTGIYSIASRRWPPGVRMWVDRRRLWAGHRPVTRVPRLAAMAARTVADLLGTELDYEVEVWPYVAVHGARLPRSGLLAGGVEFQRAKRLPRLIHENPVIFTSEQVATIAAAAERVLPPMSWDWRF
jgi:Nuclease-related domain